MLIYMTNLKKKVDDVAEYLDKPDFTRLLSGNAVLHVAINSTVNGNLSRLDLRARISHVSDFYVGTTTNLKRTFQSTVFFFLIN